MKRLISPNGRVWNTGNRNSDQNEQKKNALWARDFGLARVLNQEKLTSTKLLQEIEQVKKDWLKIIAGVRGNNTLSDKSPDLAAAHALVTIVKSEIT